MRSQPGEARRRRVAERFKSTKKADSKTPKADDTLRQAEAAKTARLRALRLAREVADKETAGAAPRPRRPGDLSRAGACENLRPQPRQNSNKAQLRMAAKASSPSSISWGEARPSRLSCTEFSRSRLEP